MAISPRELEDDIIIAHNEVRRDPSILIHELEYIVDGVETYYTPSTHLAALIGERDLKDIVSRKFWFKISLFPSHLSIILLGKGSNSKNEKYKFSECSYSYKRIRIGSQRFY